MPKAKKQKPFGTTTSRVFRKNNPLVATEQLVSSSGNFEVTKIREPGGSVIFLQELAWTVLWRLGKSHYII